jgi:hypothetical protein
MGTSATPPQMAFWRVDNQKVQEARPALDGEWGTGVRIASHGRITFSVSGFWPEIGQKCASYADKISTVTPRLKNQQGYSIAMSSAFFIIERVPQLSRSYW